MPEHAERIEGNYLLAQNIKDSLSDVKIDVDPNQDFENDCITSIVSELKEASFTIDSDGKVQIEDRQTLAIAIYKILAVQLTDYRFDIAESGKVADGVRDSLVEFVNQNYNWKGDLAR